MRKKNALILITNDDGYEAKGLKELTALAREFGDVVVISSQVPMSGMSHAITIKVPLRVKVLREEEGLTIYQTNGTPVDGVKLALHTLLPRKPDLLLSGINHGSNSSSSVLYSGTMGAAMEGAIHHIPSVGVSLLDYRPDADFRGSVSVAREVISSVFEKGLPDGVCLNVNVPAVAPEEIRGIRVCTQANGFWKEEFEERRDPNGGTYYWLTGFFHNREEDGKGEGTDEWALERKYAAVVPIDTDLTARGHLNRLESQFNEVLFGNEKKV